MPEFSDYVEARTLVNDAVGITIPLSKGGDAAKINEDLLNPYRGDFAGTNSFPVTGGRFTGGVPMRGDRWRLTSTLTIGGTDIYAPGTIIEAATNSPGQTTGNWVKYAVQI